MPSDAVLPFYPAYAFSASPTWFTWVKLTCADIHSSLRPRSDFPSNLIDPPANDAPAKPLLLFYLNHPIQFVQVGGIVVAIEDLNEHFFLITIDDSSGATIDVIYWKPKPTTAHPGLQKGNGDQSDRSMSADETNILTLLPTLQIGHCLAAKGTITQFRGTRQLNLLRLAVVPTTSAEVRHISQRAAFLDTVLSKPWQLSAPQLQKLRRKAEGEKEQDDERLKRARKRVRAKADREIRHEREIAKRWEEEEKERQKEADEAKRAGGEAMEMIKRRKAEVRREVVAENSSEDDD
jgi:Telomere regulation protein Stn1